MVEFFKRIWALKRLIFKIVLVIGVFMQIWHIYNLFSYKYITINFSDLRPIRGKVDIFYKGLKIGHVRKMRLCHSCQSTLVECVLTYKGLILPQNTTALMKKEKKRKKEYDFIELQYPEKPSSTMISNGSMLEGKTTVDIVHFMSNQHPDDIEQIKNNLMNSSQELENALTALSELFSTMQDILKNNEKNLYKSSLNLAQTTQNINQITSKFDSSIKQKTLDESVSNLNLSIQNLSRTSQTIETLTGNFTATSTDINDKTLPQVQSTLYRTECLIANTNEIVCGVKETLKKRFGLMRFFFGKPISSKNVNKVKQKCCD